MDDISEETFLITGQEGIIKRYPKDYSVMNQRSDIIHTDIQISANLNLPDVKINTSLCLKQSTIINLFKASASECNFYVIEEGPSSIVAVFLRKKNLRELLQCCRQSMKQFEDRIISSVNVLIAINEQLCMRSIIIRSSFGHSEHILPIIQNFRQKIEASLVHRQVSVPQAKEADVALTCKNESISYYQIHRILSDDAYGLGQSIQKFIKYMGHKYDENSEYTPADAVVEIKAKVEDTVKIFFDQHNISTHASSKILPFCRPAVEKFMFTKLHSVLFPLFRAQTEQQDNEFLAKIEWIQDKGAGEAMNFLEIKEKYRLLESESPYNAAVTILNQVKTYQNPLEKLNTMLTAMSTMKTEVVDYWNGAEALETMDDELPIIIFVIAMAKVPYLAAEVALLQEYIGTNVKFEKEARILTDIEASINFIINEWPTD